MLKVPDVDGVSVVFGDIAHMPKYETIPDEFKTFHGNAYCDAVSSWFFGGAEARPNGIAVKGERFVAKPGVDVAKALAAIKAVLSSYQPKHEHKQAACAFMLSEWFDIAEPEKKRA